MDCFNLGKIYLLRDPVTNLVRYVGQTALSLEDRLFHHFRDRLQKKNKTNHKCRWINKLFREHGVKPLIELIEEVQVNELNKREKYWINYYLKLGFDLTNTSGKDYFRVYRKHSLNTSKKIYCYNKDGFFKLFNSGREAAKELNIDYKTISESANGLYRNIEFVFSFNELSDSKLMERFIPGHSRDKIIGIHKVSGELMEFDSQMAAANELKCNFRNINQCLKGIRKSCANYKWYYKKDYYGI